jgi:hypothetical protein
MRIFGLWSLVLACRRLASDRCVSRRDTGTVANDQRSNYYWKLRFVLALLFRFLNRLAKFFDGFNLWGIE